MHRDIEAWNGLELIRADSLSTQYTMPYGEVHISCADKLPVRGVSRRCLLGFVDLRRGTCRAAAMHAVMAM